MQLYNSNYILIGAKMKTSLMLILSLVLPLGATPVFAQNYVGIILSGYEKDCTVLRQGTTYRCAKERHLYIGDRITKKPSINVLMIKWAPYVSGAIKDEISMEVVGPSGQLKGKTLVASLKQYVADFVKPPEHGEIGTFTRTSVQLLSHATLMQDYPMEISWPDETITSFTVVDMANRKIYESMTESKAPVFLVPSKIGIKSLEKYTVYITSNWGRRKLDILLMDRMTQEEVLAGLRDIDGENLPKPDSLIRKAAYLQLISDVYPDKIDLYWLGNQLLEENKNLYRFTADQKRIIEALTDRYYDHYKKAQ